MDRTLSAARLAVAAVLATIALMTLGSVVHATGSSLACPDWPLCHGSAMPAMTGGVQFEHSHRLAALAVVALTVSLTIVTWRRSGHLERRLALLACALVAVQATLGALTVLLLLPPAISVAHLATSMAFLAVLVTLAVRLGGLAHDRPERASQTLFTITGALAYAQAVAGGVVRHLGAAFACPDVPLCLGRVWPVGTLARLQVAHRAGALLVSALVVVSAAVAIRRRAAAESPAGWRLAIAFLPVALVLAQIGLGVAVVWTGASLGMVTAHHATGALLLAALALVRSTR